MSAPDGRWRGAHWWRQLSTVLIGACVCTFLLGGVMWIRSWKLTDDGWRLLLSAIGLALNIVLCTTQFIVLLNVTEFNKDHVNHLDVEKAVAAMAMPEQILQIIVLCLLAASRSWVLLVPHVPLSLWHAYALLSHRPPIRIVLGKDEEFKRDIRRLVTWYYAKTALYGVCLVANVVLFVQFAVQVVLRSGLLKDAVQLTIGAFSPSSAAGISRAASAMSDRLAKSKERSRKGAKERRRKAATPEDEATARMFVEAGKR